MKILRTILFASLALAPLAMSAGCARMPLTSQSSQAKAIPTTGKPSLPADSGSASARAAPRKIPGSTIPNAKDAGL